jgi:hypothetical protein
MDAGKPLGGINIMLDGAKADSTTTAANGYYTFRDLPAGGGYTVTPRAKMNFTPPSHAFKNLTRDESADFGVVPPEVYRISGRVMDAGKPLGGINIMLDGAKADSTTTDANGYYTFRDLPAGGGYTVTPRTKMNLTPPSHAIKNLTRDESADFRLVPREVYRISGQVTDAGKPLSGINITLDGAKTDSTTTDANGYYTFRDLPAGGSYTVTPRAKMKLTPPSHAIKNLTRDQSADFSGFVEQECTDADENHEEKIIIDHFGAGWRRQVERDPPKIKADALRGQEKATLGAFEYQSTFKGCKAAFITARYVWEVTGPRETTGVSGEKRFLCLKVLGIWGCN